MGALTATIFEFLVAKIMLHLFGEVWWDYEDKPFNYQGIVCLESTLAWGLYTILLFRFLHGMVVQLVDAFPYRFGVCIGNLVILVFVVDLGRSLRAARKDKYYKDQSYI